MSAEAVTVVLHHSKAQSSAKLVLWGIANHHSDYGAWPSMATLAKYASVSERRVQQIIRELVELGEIAVEEQGGLGQRQYKTNRYHILIQCPPDCDGSLNHKTGVKSSASGVKSGAVRGEIQGQSGVKPISPEPNKELNKEPIGRDAKDHPLSDNWNPDPRLVEMFATKWPDIDPDYQIEQFKLYYLSKGTKFKNWDLVFQKWMNSEQARAKTQPWRAAGGNSTAAKAKKESERTHTEQYLAELKEMERQSAPPPKCEHGNNLALCTQCLKRIG